MIAFTFKEDLYKIKLYNKEVYLNKNDKLTRMI